MALKNVHVYSFDNNFNELFRDVEIEDASDVAICALEPSTTQ